MRKSLQELQQALAGVVGFSAALEELAGALFNNLLPRLWSRLCPPTSRPLTSWLVWMQRRHEQFVSWVQVSPSACSIPTEETEMSIFIQLQIYLREAFWNPCLCFTAAWLA